MNPTAYDSRHEDLTQGNRRVLAGVGVSLAVHLLLMFAYRHAGPSAPAFEHEAPSSITVTIRPPPPPPSAPPRPQAAPRVAADAAPRPVRRAAPAPVIAVPPEQERAGEPFVVRQQAEPVPEGDSGEAPKFDMNAARQTARQLAGQTKLGREGTALAQFPDPPLETESKFAKAISKAKRRNCKDGVPGGLLAPLFLMMDKKDSGCKW